MFLSSLRVFLLCVPLLGYCSMSGQVRADSDIPLAITGATIITGTGETIESGTILIEKGRIVDLGSSVNVPDHARRIDATGMIAYPGFIDAHVHLGISKDERTEEQRKLAEDENPDPAQGPLPATRFANRRGIRAAFRALDGFTPIKKDIEAHRALGFTTALIAPRDGILSGSSDIVNLGDRPIRRSVVATDVAHHASFSSGEPGSYPRSLLGVFAQFRQVMLDAGRHAKLKKHFQRHPTTAQRVPEDRTLDALQRVLARSTPVVFEANTENEIRRALDLCGEFNLDVIISGGKEAWKVADRLKAERVGVILSLKFDDEPEYGKKDKKGSKGKKGKGSDESESKGEGKTEDKEEVKKGKDDDKKIIYEPLKVRKERRRLWEEQVANAAKLYKAGVLFGFRTRDFEKPSELFDNLRKVIERGLPEEAAIAALTSAPATILGQSSQLGSIARGHIANVALFDKPISDKKSKAKYVFIDGVEYKLQSDDEKDKSNKGDKEDKNGDDDGSDEESAATEEETPSTEESTEQDKGPKWASEIKVDRIPKTRTGGSVLIRNATIIPVSSPTLENASILIRDGKIQAIGKNLSAPSDVTIIDASGRFVIPGFVDAHSHLGIDGVNEGALAISAEVRIADTINPHAVSIYRALAGGTTTHHAMHGSANPIGGQNITFKLKYGGPVKEMLIPSADRTIKFALGENVTQANSFRNRGKRFPNTRMGVEHVIRSAFEAAKRYTTQWEVYDRKTQGGQDVPPPRRDLRLEAIAGILAGDITVHSHCYRSDEILRLLAVAEDYGVRIGVLQHVLEGYRIAPEIARHGAAASTFSNFWAYKIEAYGAIPHNAALMTNHGINVSLNSDSANTIRYLGQEAAKSIRWGGLDENQALRLVTLNPAIQLKIEDRVGSLEVGKDGDIAIFNGHPLNTFSKCVMTLIDGEVYFEDDDPDSTEPAAEFTIPAQVTRAIPTAQHDAYAIVDATIHTMAGAVIEKGTVVILDGKIHAVGKDISPPPGAGVIDGSGLHVYPGLIDAGGTMGLIEIGSTRSTRDSSDIAEFSPALHASTAIHSHSQHIRIARTAGITTALAMPSGGKISGQSAIVHLNGWTMPQMLVSDEFALHMSVPSLPVHLREGRRRFGPPVTKKKQKKDHKEAVLKIEKFMRDAKHYAKVKGLAQADASIEYEVDLSLEAMIPYVRGEKPVVFRASSYKQILDTIEFAEKHELKPVIFGGTASWKLADTLAEKNIPVIFNGPLGYPRGEFETWDGIYRCAGVLDKAGVKYAFASNSASGAYNLGITAGMAVAHGLPQARAERALTLGAAELLGIADRVGSIEVGKQADLIVTTGSPLQTVTQVTHMFIDGKPIELTSMHTDSYEKFKNRPKPNLPPVPQLRGPASFTGR